MLLPDVTIWSQCIGYKFDWHNQRLTSSCCHASTNNWTRKRMDLLSRQHFQWEPNADWKKTEFCFNSVLIQGRKGWICSSFPGLRKLKVRWSNGERDEVMNDESPFKPGLRIQKSPYWLGRVDSYLGRSAIRGSLFRRAPLFWNVEEQLNTKSPLSLKQQGINMPNATRTGKIINLIQNML